MILDRYVASNAAYGAARMHEGGDGEFVGWIENLEFDRLGCRAGLQLYLDVPSRGEQRARAREAEDVSRHAGRVREGQWPAGEDR